MSDDTAKRDTQSTLNLSVRGRRIGLCTVCADMSAAEVGRCRLDVVVAEQHLNAADVVTSIEEVRGEGVGAGCEARQSS